MKMGFAQFKNAALILLRHALSRPEDPRENSRVAHSSPPLA
jgi:hypothetical protein